jgi:hypothetical protein
MKKVCLILYMFSFVIIASGQNTACETSRVASVIDSIIVQFNIQEIYVNIASYPGFIPVTSGKFTIDKGFLIVDKVWYFNLSKLVMFRVRKYPLKDGNYIDFQFD